jgi:hypothetical protein
MTAKFPGTITLPLPLKPESRGHLNLIERLTIKIENIPINPKGAK